MDTICLEKLFRVGSGDGIAIGKLSSLGKYPVYGGNGVNGYTSQCNVSAGTMVIGRVGEKCGNVYITTTDSWVSDNALIVRKKEAYDDSYLRYLLEYTNLNDYANRNAQPVISGRIIYNIEVPYTSDMRQQQGIANTLACFDTYIDDLAELLEKKMSIRDGALEDLVSGRTKLDAFSGEWKEYTIDDITQSDLPPIWWTQ